MKEGPDAVRRHLVETQARICDAGYVVGLRHCKALEASVHVRAF